MSKYDVKQEVTDKFSLRGRVFHKLREDILSGKYQEHEELKEVAIGEEMGVSRTPVREAFRQLELEGLIQIIPNKGAYVTGITQKDVKDIYMIRSLLEGLCARWATEHITKEQMEEMEENVYLSKFHAQKGHLEQLAELDNRFHDILYEACDSKMLEHQLKDFHQYVLRVRKKTLASANRGPKSNEEHEQIMEAMGQVLLMLLLGIVLVYFVMVAQFQSLKSPFIIMFAIPLAFTGGFLGLFLGNCEVSVVAVIGFVMLAGIIVNNGIVIVDYMNQLIAQGMEKHEAILQAGRTRLRPVLMTALTTILGLLPMVFGTDMGAAMGKPMAIVTVGGLLYGTLLTLLVVPCIYDLMNCRKTRGLQSR